MTEHSERDGSSTDARPPVPMAQSLMDTVTGQYIVETASSTYFIDLDGMVFRRAPRTNDIAGSLLRRDMDAVRLLELVECTVGNSMHLLIDLDVPGVLFTCRATTPVVSIRNVEPA